MRILIDWYSLVSDAKRCLRHKRWWWWFGISIALGLVLGVVFALMVEDPEHSGIVAQIVEGEFSFFSCLILYSGVLASGFVVIYIGARFPSRWPFWVYIFFVSYAFARGCTLAVLDDGIFGVVSIIVVLPLVVCCLVGCMAFLIALDGVQLYTYNFACNKPHIKCGLRYLFVTYICLLGLLLFIGFGNLIINLV